ncbi:MAG: hypothetical protein RL621_23 [Bacteroidota bacterium]|jgi:hypothetical protein
MTKFAKIKKCLSNVWNCKRLWIGAYFCLFIISVPTVLTGIIKGDLGIISVIIFLWTGLVTLSGFHEYYWPSKEMDKTEE